MTENVQMFIRNNVCVAFGAAVDAVIVGKHGLEPLQLQVGKIPVADLHR